MSLSDLRQRGPLPPNPLQQSKPTSFHKHSEPTKQVKEAHKKAAELAKEKIPKTTIFDKVGKQLLKATGTDNIAKLLKNPAARDFVAADPHWSKAMIANSPLGSVMKVKSEKLTQDKDALVVTYTSIRGEKEKLTIPIEDVPELSESLHDSKTQEEIFKENLSFARIKSFYTLLKLGYDEIALMQESKLPEYRELVRHNKKLAIPPPIISTTGVTIESLSTSSGAVADATSIASKVDIFAACNYVKYAIEFFDGWHKAKQAVHFKDLADRTTDPAEKLHCEQKSQDLIRTARWQVSTSTGGILSTSGVFLSGGLSQLAAHGVGVGDALSVAILGGSGSAIGGIVAAGSMTKEAISGMKSNYSLAGLIELEKEANKYFKAHPDPELERFVRLYIKRERQELETKVNGNMLGIGAAGSAVLGSSLAIILVAGLTAVPTGGVSLGIGGAAVGAIAFGGGKGIYIYRKGKQAIQRESKNALKNPLKTREGLLAELTARVQEDLGTSKKSSFVLNAILKHFLKITPTDFLLLREIASEELEKNQLYLHRAITKELSRKFGIVTEPVKMDKVKDVGKVLYPVEGEGKGELGTSEESGLEGSQEEWEDIDIEATEEGEITGEEVSDDEEWIYEIESSDSEEEKGIDDI